MSKVIKNDQKFLHCIDLMPVSEYPTPGAWLDRIYFHFQYPEKIMNFSDWIFTYTRKKSDNDKNSVISKLYSSFEPWTLEIFRLELTKTTNGPLHY